MKRKIPLLKWSIGFIVCFFINAILLVFVPWLPGGYPIFDMAMQFVIMVTVLVFFKQWETSLELWIKNRYTLMLKVKSASNRLTFMARVMNQAKAIMKNCDDEQGADRFVQECQHLCDQVYESNSDLSR